MRTRFSLRTISIAASDAMQIPDDTKAETRTHSSTASISGCSNTLMLGYVSFLVRWSRWPDPPAVRAASPAPPRPESAAPFIPCRPNFATVIGSALARSLSASSRRAPMINLLRDPLTLIAALTIALVAGEIVAVHWL